MVQSIKARLFVQFLACKTAEQIRGRHCTFSHVEFEVVQLMEMQRSKQSFLLGIKSLVPSQGIWKEDSSKGDILYNAFWDASLYFTDLPSGVLWSTLIPGMAWLARMSPQRHQKMDHSLCH